MRRIFPSVILLLVPMLFACTIGRAQESFAPYEKDFIAAKQLILDGHVKDGTSKMASLLKNIDPTKEPINYWSLSINLADYLNQSESYADESVVLNQALSKLSGNSNQYVAQETLVRVGRNLAFTGHADDAAKILRNVTGGDARWVLTPPQRKAARLLSLIELDRNNVAQAAIWMRRAVVGAQVDKGTSSEEAVDTLTDYAIYLRRTRQLFESYDLFTRLIPTYD